MAQFMAQRMAQRGGKTMPSHRVQHGSFQVKICDNWFKQNEDAFLPAYVVPPGEVEEDDPAAHVVVVPVVHGDRAVYPRVLQESAVLPVHASSLPVYIDSVLSTDLSLVPYPFSASC